VEHSRNGLGAGDHALDLSGLAQGAYWLEVRLDDGRRVTFKVMVQR
jgi:hypothetical protein